MCDGCMQKSKEPYFRYEDEEMPKIVSKEQMIARIQQFYDHLDIWYQNIREERRIAEREEKQELDWPQEKTCLRILDDFSTHFEDVLSDRAL
jgi:hypothetical protein